MLGEARVDFQFVAATHQHTIGNAILCLGFKLLSKNQETFIEQLYRHNKISHKGFAMSLGDDKFDKNNHRHPSVLVVGGYEMTEDQAKQYGLQRVYHAN